MNEYYVYIYLDPRKKGKFIYGDLEFEYEPFYVGKGKGDRIYRHLHLYKSDYTNEYKYNKIRKIKLENLEPVVIKIFDNLDEKNAFKKENETILKIGRLKNGPLINFSDGGEGQSGYKHREEDKKKIGERVKNSEKWQIAIKSDEHKKNLSKSLMGHEGHVFIHSDKAKEKIRIAQSGNNNSFYKKTHTKTLKNKWSSERKGNNNQNSVLYEIKSPIGDILKFKGMNEIKDYTSKTKLFSPTSIIKYGISKGYQIISKIKLNKIF